MALEDRREIFALTTFTVPEGLDFPPERWYRPSEKWKRVLQPLEDSDRYFPGALGRSVEHPDKGIVVTGWSFYEGEVESVTSLEAWQAFESELVNLLRSPLHTVQIRRSAGDMVLYHNRLMGARAEIVAVDFPKGHRESMGNGIKKIRGLGLRCYVGGIDSSTEEVQARIPFRAGPISGWILPQPLTQTENDQAIWICAWKSEEREAQYKVTEKRTESGFVVGVLKDEDGNDEIEMPVEEFFEKQLRDRGAIRIRKEYFQMAHVFPRGRY